MGTRRKKITDRLRKKIEELLGQHSPGEVDELLRHTRDQVSLSVIYKIQKQKTGQPMTMQVIDTSQLDVDQRKQLADFLISLSLPSPFLTQSADFYNFVQEDIEGVASKLYRGECSLSYTAPFLSHHIFAQAKETFQRETVWSNINNFTDDFNKLLANCQKLWRSIYLDSKEVLPASVELDVPHYRFVPLVYEDAVGWAVSKNLTLVTENNYDYGWSGDKQFVVRCWSPERLEVLVEFGCEDKTIGNKVALFIRDSHMKLRQEYRESNQVGNLAEAMNRLELQRQNILRSLEQLASRLKPL